MKVLLYLKRNEQNADGFCPLMGKITVNGKKDSVVQFACKININPLIWDSTSQRCTGKSNEAISTNREIESLLLLLLAAKQGKLFPMLHNTSINPHFKKIAKQCGINRRLTYNSSRHRGNFLLISRLYRPRFWNR